MLFSLAAVKDNLRNRQGRRVFYLAEGDLLTSEAKDWLRQERIDILPAAQAKPEHWRLPGGGYLAEKPEHMTHLNGDTLVPKTHPRIRFRGAMDTLEAELLLCAGDRHVAEILALARDLVRWEVLEAPVEERPLLGLTEQQLRERSHRPQVYYGQPHFMPQPTDSKELLLLNRARCAARAAELAAAEAFCDREGNPTRVDILRTLNRMSSAIYLLMVMQKAENTDKG